MLSRKEDMNPSCGERKEDRLTKLLPRSVKSIHEYFKKIRREMYAESPRGFEIESDSRFSYRECEHAATPYDVQCSHMASFAIREREGEGMPKKGTLSGFLHEYEYQTQKFRAHVTFPEFFKVKVRRNKQHNVDIFFCRGCEHAVTPYDVQRIHMAIFSIKKKECRRKEILVVSYMSMNLKLRSLEIILIFRSFARSW